MVKFSLIQSGRLLQKNNKIMPRSVNSVAKRARRKNNEASQRLLW
jgi:hypothetical protein